MVVIDKEFSDNKDEDNLRGIQNIDLLLSALEEPKQTFNKQELYSDVLEKASCYMRSFARNHAFQNGNKRTALLATITFLEENGYEVIATNEKLFKLVELVVTRKLEIGSIKKRLKKYVRQISRERKPSLSEFFENLISWSKELFTNK